MILNRHKPIRAIRTSYRISGIAFSPTGGLVAAVGHKTRRIVERIVHATIWSTNSDEPVVSFEQAGVQTRIGFSADGKWFTLVGNDMLIHDVRNGNAIARIHREGCAIRDWAFSADNKWLAVGFDDGQIQLLRKNGLSPVRRLEIRKNEYSLDFSPKGNSLAVTILNRQRGIIRVYAAADITLEREVRSRVNGALLGSYFGPDERSHVMVVDGGKVNVWQPGEKTATLIPIDLPKEVWSLNLSPNKRQLVVGSCNTLKNRLDKKLKFQGVVYIYDLADNYRRKAFLAHNDCVIAVASCSERNLLASATVSQVKIWNYLPLCSSSED